jgi:drug/metabolite transporter (DMT)-like permease
LTHNNNNNNNKEATFFGMSYQASNRRDEELIAALRDDEVDATDRDALLVHDVGSDAYGNDTEEGIDMMKDDDEQRLVMKHPKAEDEAAAGADKTRALLISFISMIIIGLGNKVFQVLQFIPMYNYPLFVNLMTTFVYLPMSFAYIIPMLKYGTAITQEATEIPKTTFAVMGGLDSLAGIMQSLAVNYIANGSLVTLLTQAAIPVSMVISKWLLGAKYKLSQYIGAIVVAGGIVLVLLPRLLEKKKPGDEQGEHVLMWSLVMIFSCVPMCLSSVYKEKALGDTEIDAVYMNGWIAVFQFMAALPLLVPSAPASKVAIGDIPDNLWNGMRCLAKINTVHVKTSKLHVDDCAMAPIYVSVYLLFNLSYNILIILILKFGSANILWLAMTVLVPIVNVAFALDFMPDHKPLEWQDWLGLVIIMSGLIIYRFYGQARRAYKNCRRSMKHRKKEKQKPLLEQGADWESIQQTEPSSPVTPATPFSPTGYAPGTPGMPAGVSTPIMGLDAHVHRTHKKGKKKGRGRH